MNTTNNGSSSLPGRVLLTGANGGVGRMLRPLFEAAGISLVASDMQTASASPQPRANEQYRRAELGTPKEVEAAMQGCDSIVHMGGYSVEGPWESILNANIIGTWNLFEAARKAGVRRVVFASSNHAVGFYERSTTIDNERMARPDSRYGVSKVFGEAVGALYADKHGISVTCLRIGNVGEAPLDRRRLSIWFHPEDLFQLIMIGLTHPDIHYEILYGMSDNERAWWDNSRATALGYHPKHKAEDFAKAVLAVAEKPDAVADRFQGGAFCSQEYRQR